GKTNLSHDGLNPAHVLYWWVNNPTLGEFCFTMIGRADIEGSKSNVAMNAWLPQASYPCGNFSDTSSFKFRRSKGSIGHAFTVRIRTENKNQTSFYPFVPHEISVLVELILGHLRYLLTDVPPQPNSPPDNVLRPDRPAEASLGSKRRGCYPASDSRIGLESSSTGSSFPADSAKPVPLAVVSLDSRQGHRIPLVRTSSELAVRRPGKAPERAIPSPSPSRHEAVRSRHVSSSSSPPTVDGGCSPWRPDAVMSTTGRERHSVLRIFKGRRECTGHHATCGALPAAGPYLRLSRFQGRALQRHPFSGLVDSAVVCKGFYPPLGGNYPPLRATGFSTKCDDQLCESTVPLGKTNLSHDGLNPAHVPYWWVNNPTLGEFCFIMIGRADIEGSKSNVAMNAWLPQASYPCGNFSDTSSFKFRRSKGSIGHAFTVRIRTENQNQTSFYPFVPHEISVLVELILGHLRYLLTDVPPQPNSPPDNVLRPDRPAEASLGSKRRGCYPASDSRIGLESSSTGSSFPADSAKPVPLAVVSLDSRQGHRIPLVRTSSELAVRTQAARQQSTGSELGPPSPALRANPFPKVTDPFCRLPLPTLGCSPWRPDPVMSTTGRERHSVLRIFKGRRECTGHHATCGALPAAGPYLWLSRFQVPFCSDRRALLLIEAWLLPRRPGIGRTLQRHPFSGLVDSADERFARQYRCGPPPEFPLASPRSGIVHHLSGPDRHAHTRTLLRRSRSVGCAPVRDPANQLPCALRVYSPVDSHTCQTPWSVPGLGHHLNPRRSTPRIDRRTGLLRSASDQDASLAPICFPPDNFKHSLTLFSKSFSSLPRGTCSLSVSRPYLALDGIYRPIGAAFPNNPTRRQRLVVRQGPGTTGLSPSLAPLSRELGPGPSLRTLLQTTIRTPKTSNFQAGLFPVRSPLLRESLLVSFPPLIDMLKLSG
ncbi:unnamed protein product, partial [Brassica rapa subsp. trilocularis]